MKKGFTLIELLIVVAIIAILAAIAVPNFLEAQTRSKVSRAKSDMRSVATGLESYYTDHNAYPPHGYFPAETPADIRSRATTQVLPWMITTPIAYLTSLAPTGEPFTATNTGADAKEIWIRTHLNYSNFMTPWSNGDASSAYAVRIYGNWRMASAGPDKVYFTNKAGAYWVGSYDPTNGTVSYGDIMRTSSSPDYLRP